MQIEWQDHLSIGVVEVDTQHRQLFSRFNAFLKACEEKRGEKEIVRLFWFLDAYVATHFADEERLQERIGFPDLGKHREQHEGFARQLALFRERLKSEGPTPALVSSLTLAVTGWLIQHISGMDRAIGRFMKERGME